MHEGGCCLNDLALVLVLFSVSPLLVLVPCSAENSSCSCPLVRHTFHYEVAKSELVVFVISSCSHVCHYQPPQCVLKCLRVSVTQGTRFPQPFNVSQFKSISCIWFVAFPLLFKYFLDALSASRDDANCLYRMMLKGFLCCIRCRSMLH